MIETSNAWFNAAAYAWIPGTALGLLGGLDGSLVGILAPRGRGRALVLALHFGTMLLCAGLLLAGIVAKVKGQPYGIWYGLGFPGLLGLIIFGSLTPLILRRYREAELRKSLAKDL
ncbi:MAG: hypothetical protein ABSH34_00775 [Verrucomicrobiota bacterium]|jgi:peptidoglycan/LPS O-acetylase OafA/YrhL